MYPVQHDDAAFVGGGVGRRAGAVFTADDPDATELLAVLSTKVGRLTMHVGPWPAATRPGSTSVGAAARHLVRPCLRDRCRPLVETTSTPTTRCGYPVGPPAAGSRHDLAE